MEHQSHTKKATCGCSHSHHNVHETKTKLVLYISAFVMLLEICYGHFTNSMALLSDGWHMASHVFAMGITWFAYAFSRKNRDNLKFKNGTAKVLSLSGYTSGILLLFVAFGMAIECFVKLFNNVAILYEDALMVAILGLIVNLICAFILNSKHYHEDDNLKAAYLHVLSDAVTSMLAIIALLIGKYFGISWLDQIAGIIGAFVILKWSWDLLKQSGSKLLDYEINISRY
jgi:cation diffusion facilitator family transporter